MANTQFYFEEIETNKEEAMLYVFKSNGKMSKFMIEGICVIGRKSTQHNPTIAFESPIISRNHGEISCVNGKYFYYDHGSTNGTYVNGQLIGKNAPDQRMAIEIKNGDIISFDVIKDGMHHSDRMVALFTTTVSKKTKWKRMLLNNEIAEISIGRKRDNGLNFKDEYLSENHASFFSTQKGWAIIDHDSTNGVYINNERITSPRYLHQMDVVKIGQHFFVYFGTAILFCDYPIEENATSQNDNAKKLTINITERSVMQRFKKIALLQDINLTVSAGEMVLILGGSGAGKTTFINAVMGYEKAHGKITYDDTDIYQEYERMKYEIGFVPQQDLLRGHDTVYDTLANAAEMKLPRNFTIDQREQQITNVLEELGLKRERETLVSKLSGGQRKRLSIAVEFIANPSLFFLDEPDSGLDDIMGRGLMENLRAIANKGKIIMVITHSPQRAADLFDKVIVLAKSTVDNCGHLAFYGSAEDALDFFETDSFKGIVKKINRADENGEGLADYYIEKFAKR